MLKIEIDLDSLWTGEEWDETVGSILRDELKLAIKAEVKAAIKDDKGLKRIVGEYVKKARDEALKNLGI